MKLNINPLPSYKYISKLITVRSITTFNTPNFNNQQKLSEQQLISPANFTATSLTFVRVQIKNLPHGCFVIKTLALWCCLATTIPKYIIILWRNKPNGMMGKCGLSTSLQYFINKYQNTWFLFFIYIYINIYTQFYVYLLHNKKSI